MSSTRAGPRIAPRRRMDRGVRPRHHQRGVALLVAILLVALGTIVAAAMAYNNAMTARRAAATFDFDQALLVAEGAESLAAYGLQQQLKQGSTYIGPDQAWAQPLGPAPVLPGVMLEAYLEDMQGRFNINDLVESDGETPNNTAIGVFQRLLVRLNMDPKWADYIVDWIDRDTTPRPPDGAEDSIYMEMNPPYRTPNLPITSTSELMALPGFTRQDFDRLAPHIAALPTGTKINVCTADPWVLDALTGVEQFTADPSQFEKDRAAAGGCFPPLATVHVAAPANVSSGAGGISGGTRASPGSQQTPTDLIDQKSSWFRLTSFVTLGSTEFAVYTTLYQDPTGMVRPIMRSFTPD